MTRVCPSLRKNRLGRYAIKQADINVKNSKNPNTMSRVLQNDRGRCEVKKNQPAMLGNKEKTAFYIHPLFFLSGVVYSLIGKLPLFIMSMIVAVEHELAHAFCASKLGYRLNKISLMPYGAVIDGDLKEVSLKDEISVALAGPICNLLTAGAFVALWWLYPATYPYTDTACYLSLSIAIVNLLPAYPLDGGRIFRCVIFSSLLNSERLKGDISHAEHRAKIVTLVLSLVVSAILVTVFFFCLKNGVANYGILTFALFLVSGNLSKNGDAVYTKINFCNLSALESGLEIRRVAVSENAPLKSVFRYLHRGKYLILEVYDGKEKYLGEVRQSELAEFFTQCSGYSKIGEILQKRG